MKLLIQSDDYAISKAAARGVVEGIKNGILRNTGMFMNMPWSEECAEWIQPYLNEIALGIDFNLSTGKPLLPASEVPSLVDENEKFYTSWERRRLDKENPTFEHCKIEDVRKELEAHIQKYIELFGKLPDYLHGHAYNNEITAAVQRELAEKYQLPLCSDMMERYCGQSVKEYRLKWYLHPATLENQFNTSLKNYILEHSDELLQKNVYFIIGHMGYVDRDLMNLSTYHLVRATDLEAVLSDEIKNWVIDNQVELITYKDLIK